MKRSNSISDIPPNSTALPTPGGFDEIEKNFSPNPQLLQNTTTLPTSYKLIEPKDFVDLLEDPVKRGYDEVVIVDARFFYEYGAGHIKGAIRCCYESDVKTLYKNYMKQKNVCFVFHCELSSQRGPKAAENFRNFDRKENSYPELTFPDLFVLEGGFRRFYSEYPDKCVGEYVPMRDPRFVKDGTLLRCHNRYHPKSRRIQRCFSAEVLSKPMHLDDQTLGQFGHLQKNSQF